MEELRNIYDDAENTSVSTVGQMMIGRQAQEVQAAMVVAKKFPRNPRGSYDRVWQHARDRPWQSVRCMNTQGEERK